MVRRWALYFLPVLLITVFLFTNMGRTMDQLEWYPSDSAPKNAPMQLMTGAFRLPDGTYIDIPGNRAIMGGWGALGATRIVSPFEKSLPVEFALRWFSFLEDKFYQGRFDLPVDRLNAMFEAGVTLPDGKQVTYNRLIVGMAPEGHLSVWASVDGITHEVATYQAVEVDTPWEKFFDNPDVPREDYIAMKVKEAVGQQVGARLIADGITPGRWARMRVQVAYTFVIKTDQLVSSMRFSTFNGESDYFNLMRPIPERSKRGLPKAARLEWRGKDKKNYGAEITFSEAETFAAFDKFTDVKDGGPLYLDFEIGDTNHAVTLFLRNDKILFKFEEAVVKVFRRSG